MAVNLTEGAISLISTGNCQATEMKPVLQVLEVRTVQTQTSSSENKERYRIILSDGSNNQQGMLATQLNDLVRSERLQRGSVVRLNEFVINKIRDRLILIIIGLDLIMSNCHIIGHEPRSFLSRLPASSYVHPVDQPTPPTMFMNRQVLIAENNEAPSRIVPVAGLNPFRDSRWTIKARVTAKAGLRLCYDKAKGEGKVFSFDLLDATYGGGEIRAICFNDVADQLYDQIEVGKVYFISDGKIKPAQKAYDDHMKNDHEIRLDHTSTIWPCYN